MAVLDKNMRIASPIEFKEAFLRVLAEKEATIAACWSQPKTRFTATMREFLDDSGTSQLENLQR